MKITSQIPENKFNLLFLLTASILLLVVAVSRSHGQSYKWMENQPKNTVYFETIGETGLGPSINYRHSFWLGRTTSLNMSAGLGVILYSFNEEPDLVVPSSLTLSFGKKHGFEWGIGMSMITCEQIYAPNLILGYRYQHRSTYIWAGWAVLMFYEGRNYVYNDNPESWHYMAIIPVPGIRIGYSF